MRISTAATTTTAISNPSPESTLPRSGTLKPGLNSDSAASPRRARLHPKRRVSHLRPTRHSMPSGVTTRLWPKAEDIPFKSYRPIVVLNGCGFWRRQGARPCLDPPRSSLDTRASMDADERLRLDYDQTSGLIRTLMDVRFKLLALVPTIAGAAVGVLGSPRSAAELVGVGLLGLLATMGILLYELRNAQIFDAMLLHAQALERLLGLHAARGTNGPSGVLSQRTCRHVRLFGLVTIGHELALGLVYGAALAGWTYLAAWGALRALDVTSSREIGGVIGALTGVAVMFEVQRIGTAAKKADESVVAGEARD
jgi:hypothetical protein